jgi:hypothetical protein
MGLRSSRGWPDRRGSRACDVTPSGTLVAGEVGWAIEGDGAGGVAGRQVGGPGVAGSGVGVGLDGAEGGAYVGELAGQGDA